MLYFTTPKHTFNTLTSIDYHDINYINNIAAVKRTIKQHEPPLLTIEPLHDPLRLPRPLGRVGDHAVRADADTAA